VLFLPLLLSLWVTTLAVVPPRLDNNDDDDGDDDDDDVDGVFLFESRRLKASSNTARRAFE
jgi:hypothetical protein